MTVSGKWCSRHDDGKGKRLPRAEFSSHTSSYCRKCAAAYQKTLYRKHKDNLPPKDHPWIDTSKKTMAIRKHNRIVSRMVEEHFKEAEALKREIDNLETALATLTCRRVMKIIRKTVTNIQKENPEYVQNLKQTHPKTTDNQTE